MATLSLYFSPKTLLRRKIPAAAAGIGRRLPLYFSRNQFPFSTFRTFASTSSAAVELESSAVSPAADKWKTIDPGYLSCSLPEKRPLKVAVLVSGGVDSSVALRLLHAAGHSCTAFYLKIWFQEDFENYWSECPWEEDLRYAKSVCDQVEIPPEVVHLTDEYWNNVTTVLLHSSVSVVLGWLCRG